MKTHVLAWGLLLLLFFSFSQSSAGPRERYESINEAYWSNYLEIGDTFSGSLELRKTVGGTETSKTEYLLNYEIISDMSGNMWDVSYNVFDHIKITNGMEAINSEEMVYYGISPINAILDDSSEVDFVGRLWEFFIVSDFQNPDYGVTVEISTEGVMAIYTGTLNYIDAVGALDGTVNTETGIVQSISYTIAFDDGTIETVLYELLTSNINHDGSSSSSSTSISSTDSNTTSVSSTESNTTSKLTTESDSNDDALPIGLITFITSLFIISYKKNRSH